MCYYQAPELYQMLLIETGLIDDVYKAMKSEDFAELPLVALETLRKTGYVPILQEERKSEARSTAYRNEGNKEYKAGNCMKALEYYNKALLSAPNGSQAMKLAYSNRSALLYRIRAYTACIRDINTCYAMGCSDDIAEKLKKRRADSIKNVSLEAVNYTSFSEEFFRLNVQRNPDIPCASTDVTVVNERELPKVVAARDIEVGTVVAVETPFVSLLNPGNHYLSCYYCHRMSLNLIPCPNCCYALFCNEDCKKCCMEDTHSTECQLMEVNKSACLGLMSRLTFKAVLKMKQKCTWKEFIAASHSVGTERMKNSSVNEIYDSNYQFSLLSFREIREIKYGAMYNFGFMCATLIHYLSGVPSFLPQMANERKVAIEAMARMMMRMFLLFNNKVEINNVCHDKSQEEIKHFLPNFACLSFAGKLRHDCEANILLVGLNNMVGLVALHPIKKGTELTISYIDHAYDYMYSPLVSKKERIIQLYRFSIVCHCRVCDGTWDTIKAPKLTADQRKCYQKWQAIGNCKDDVQFKSVCETLTVLNGFSHTKEYQNVYICYRRLLCLLQYATTKNIGISE